MELNHIGLFEGIGGFSLAAEWMGWKTVSQCEILPFAQKVLKYHFPKAIQHGDIKTTDFSVYRGKCDILTGGFPCQGFSVAGLRLGTDDNRYLWPEYLRAIDECQPPFILGENVTGILSMEDKSGIYRDVFAKVESRTVTRLQSFDQYEAVYTRQAKMLVNSICESLEERGYEIQTFAVPAASVGAPHKRERIWFVAWNNTHAHSSGLQASRSKQQATGSKQHGELGGRIIINTKCNDDGGQGEGNGLGVVENELDQAGWQQSPNNPKSPSVDAPKKRRAKRTTEWASTHSDSNGQQWATEPKTVNNKRIREGLEKRHVVAALPIDGFIAGTEYTTNADIVAGRVKQHSKAKKHITTDPDRDKRSKGRHREDGSNSPGGHISPRHSRNSEQPWQNFPTQSPVCIGDDGVSTELDGITFSKWRNESIKGGGNAVVPQVVVEFYKAIESLISEQHDQI